MLQEIWLDWGCGFIGLGWDEELVVLSWASKLIRFGDFVCWRFGNVWWVQRWLDFSGLGWSFGWDWIFGWVALDIWLGTRFCWMAVWSDFTLVGLEILFGWIGMAIWFCWAGLVI